MKKAISMRCSQEQFYAVKDKLVDMKFIENPTDYINCKDSYLSNNYSNKNLIGFTLTLMDYVEIYETWNEEIFLNACGIETERIFKGSELQYLNEEGTYWKELTNPNIKLRLKPANLIKKQELESQIAELQNQLKNL